VIEAMKEIGEEKSLLIGFLKKFCTKGNMVLNFRLFLMVWY